jgi:hypothetical protein
MGGARLGYRAQWLAQSLGIALDSNAMLEYHAQWLARGLGIAPDGWRKAWVSHPIVVQCLFSCLMGAWCLQKD